MGETTSDDDEMHHHPPPTTTRTFRNPTEGSTILKVYFRRHCITSWKMWDEYALEQLLGGYHLILDKKSISWILNHIDCFVEHSRDNERVKTVSLYPSVFSYPYELYGEDFYAESDDPWDLIGQAIGNLHSLETLCISACNRTYHNCGDYDDSNWGKLARILRRVRQKVSVEPDEGDIWHAGEVQALATAIRGHPKSFDVSRCCNFPYESDSLYSALATLPALYQVNFSSSGLQAQARQARPEDESVLERLTELLRVSSLRSVCFDNCFFTPDICRATAKGLMEGTSVTMLEFSRCSFADQEQCAVMMANSLSRNTSVSHMKVESPPDQALCSALATALPLNLTLLDLHLSSRRIDELSPVILALEKNTRLRSLKVNLYGPMDGSLSTAIKNGLGMNETLENLELSGVELTDLWCRALSFLRTNKALKSLYVGLGDVSEARLAAFRIDIAAMLEENTSLESLSIKNNGVQVIEAEVYVALVTSLQHNTTLKTFSIYHNRNMRLTDDEDKHMAKFLQKNYALESLPDIKLENGVGDLGAFLRLNAAGRRYLIEAGSSISKGVVVLCGVSDDVNCVFLHLLENPGLCDRSDAEKVSAREINSRSTSPTPISAGEKREPVSLHGGRESRRRHA